jgi:hypothetical protein
MIGLLLFLYASIRFGRTTVPGLVQAAVLYAASVVSFGLLVLGANWLIDKLASQRKDMKKDIKVWTAMLLMLAVVTADIVYANYHDIPLMPVIFFVLALISLAGSLVVILSPITKDAVTKPVRKPRGLTRWVDLYASADPVPNGPTRVGDAESVPVWNRGSILSDHTSYWENLDGFVLRIARVCAETAGSSWQDKLPPVTHSAWVDRRAAWRVDLLRWAVRLNALLWLVGFFLLWTQHQSWVPLPFKLPSWAPPEASITAARFAVLVILATVAAWATAALLRWPWSHWVRAEQELMLAHGLPTGSPMAPLIGMGMVITLLVILAWALGYESRAGELLADPGKWFRLPMLMVGGSFILALIVLWLRPAPRLPDTTATDSK